MAGRKENHDILTGWKSFRQLGAACLNCVNWDDKKTSAIFGDNVMKLGQEVTKCMKLYSLANADVSLWLSEESAGDAWSVDTCWIGFEADTPPPKELSMRATTNSIFCVEIRRYLSLFFSPNLNNRYSIYWLWPAGEISHEPANHRNMGICMCFPFRGGLLLPLYTLRKFF